MRVHIATDHAAFEVKQYLAEQLTENGFEIVDHGAYGYDAADDYPDFCIPCAEAVVKDPGSLGIVLGGSGNGEQIAANKVAGVRAVLAYSPELARLGREHNDANVLSIGGRMQSKEEALQMALTFLTSPYSNDPRHQRRIDKLSAYEERTKK
jgi:ribose 5-phosphate isomerase B